MRPSSEQFMISWQGPGVPMLLGAVLSGGVSLGLWVALSLGAWLLLG